MQPSTFRVRHLLAVVAATLALGVAGHGVCQAIEHHDGLKDAVALCAAAVAVIATMRLGFGGRAGRPSLSVVRVPLLEVIPASTYSIGARTSPIWLQRFQN